MASIEILGSAIALGLAGSIHCAAMCGPIYFAVSGFYEKPSAFIYPLMWQLLGKTLGYAALGLVFGLAGKGLSMLVFQNTLMIISGSLLLLLGLNGLIRFRFLTGFENRLNQSIGRLISQKAKGAFFLGILNGFVPCGLVYAAGVGAMASGSPQTGMLYMVLFGLGTVPVLVFTAFSRWLVPLRRRLTGAVWKQIPVLLLGVLFLLKGVGVGIPYLSPDLNNKNTSKNCCAPKTIIRHSETTSP